jgi:hypothetical protein
MGKWHGSGVLMDRSLWHVAVPDRCHHRSRDTQSTGTDCNRLQPSDQDFFMNQKLAVGAVFVAAMFMNIMPTAL